MPQIADKMSVGGVNSKKNIVESWDGCVCFFFTLSIECFDELFVLFAAVLAGTGNRCRGHDGRFLTLVVH